MDELIGGMDMSLGLLWFFEKIIGLRYLLRCKMIIEFWYYVMVN